MKSATYDFPGRAGTALRNREPATRVYPAYPASTHPVAKAPTGTGARSRTGERELGECGLGERGLGECGR